MSKTFLSRLLILIIIPGLVFTACIPGSFYTVDAAVAKDKYGVFIGTSSSDKRSFKKYDIVVIDAQYYSKKSITKLKRQGKKVYSYLNIGTIEDFRPYAGKFQDITYDIYDDWPDEKWIDVSKKRWRDYTVNVLAKKMKKKGVDGFFIDNTDVYYKYKTGKTYYGLVKILKGLKKYKKDIIINGGDTFVKKVIKKKHLKKTGIDGINQECVFTAIDFDNNTFKKQTKSDTAYFKRYLKKAKNKGLDIYVLEYAKKSKKSLRKNIAKYCKSKGYNYYISSTLDLK